MSHHLFLEYYYLIFSVLSQNMQAFQDARFKNKVKAICGLSTLNITWVPALNFPLFGSQYTAGYSMYKVVCHSGDKLPQYCCTAWLREWHWCRAVTKTVVANRLCGFFISFLHSRDSLPEWCFSRVNRCRCFPLCLFNMRRYSRGVFSTPNLRFWNSVMVTLFITYTALCIQWLLRALACHKMSLCNTVVVITYYI